MQERSQALLHDGVGHLDTMLVARLQHMGPWRMLAAHPCSWTLHRLHQPWVKRLRSAQHMRAGMRRSPTSSTLACPSRLRVRTPCLLAGSDLPTLCYRQCAPYVGSLARVVTQARRSCRLRAANRPQRAPCTSLFAADVPARGALRELCSVRTSSTAARAPPARPARLAARGCAPGRQRTWRPCSVITGCPVRRTASCATRSAPSARAPPSGSGRLRTATRSLPR
jgi:hypothetical protein